MADEPLIPGTKGKGPVDEKVIELTKPKTRVEEERFFTSFSGTQLNAVLLLILAATFLVQGVVRYVDLIGKVEILAPWFYLVLPALIFLTISVFSVTLGNVIVPLTAKRIINLVTFSTFVLGFFLFLGSLIFLLLSI